VLAEAFETDGLATLREGELPDLVPILVVDVGVFGELGVGPTEVALELLGDEKVQGRDDYHGGYAEDQEEVEEGS